MPPAPRARSKRDDFLPRSTSRKVCAFCADKTVQIDYKEVNRLRRYLSERAKIEPRTEDRHLRRPPARAVVALKRRATSRCFRTPAAPPALARLTARLSGARSTAWSRALMLAGGVAAGAFGSLLGLGGGLLIVPLLTIGFGLPLREAVGVSLVCVIVTSSASAGVYLQRRQANLRSGMVLELFTAIGRHRRRRDRVPDRRAAARGLFAACSSTSPSRCCAAPARPPAPTRTATSDAPATARGPTPATGGDLAGGCPRRVGSVGAGVASALLGIGGGLIKVPSCTSCWACRSDRDRDEQPDDRHHRLGERDRLPAPGGIDAYAPARPRSACSSARPRLALGHRVHVARCAAVRAGPAVHGGRDGAPRAGLD
jgi:ribosomal protein S18